MSIKYNVGDVVDISVYSQDILYKYEDVIVSEILPNGFIVGIEAKTSQRVWCRPGDVTSLTKQNQHALMRKASKIADIKEEKFSSTLWLRNNMGGMIKKGAPIAAVRELFKRIGFDSPGLQEMDMGKINYEFKMMLPVFITIMQAQTKEELYAKFSETISEKIKSGALQLWDDLRAIS